MADGNEYNYRRNSHRAVLENESASARTYAGPVEERSGAAAVLQKKAAARAAAEKRKKLKRKYMIRRAAAIVIALAILALVIFGIVKLAKAIFGRREKNVVPVMSSVVFEAGSSGPAAEQLLTETGKKEIAAGAQIYYETDITQINFRIPGTYRVYLIYRQAGGEETRYETAIEVRDTVPPVGVARDRVVKKGTALTVTDFIQSVSDETDVAVSLLTEPDFGKVGVQVIDILLEDRGGNRTRLTASLTVTEEE